MTSKAKIGTAPGFVRGDRHGHNPKANTEFNQQIIKTGGVKQVKGRVGSNKHTSNFVGFTKIPMSSQAGSNR